MVAAVLYDSVYLHLIHSNKFYVMNRHCLSMYIVVDYSKFIRGMPIYQHTGTQKYDTKCTHQSGCSPYLKVVSDWLHYSVYKDLPQFPPQGIFICRNTENLIYCGSLKDRGNIIPPYFQWRHTFWRLILLTHSHSKSTIYVMYSKFSA